MLANTQLVFPVFLVSSPDVGAHVSIEGQAGNFVSNFGPLASPHIESPESWLVKLVGRCTRRQSALRLGGPAAKETKLEDAEN